MPAAMTCTSTWLVGAARSLAETASRWHGTLMAVFQPAEETAAGAQGMIDDGLFERFPKPDVILGQHVMPLPAGSIGMPRWHHALRRPTASRSDCSDAARMARCHRRASTRW